VVVRFLAILELFKQGLVDLEQATTFGDITVVWLGGAGQEGRDDAPWHADLALVDAYDG
jgi:segregation and condensation protein A